MKPLQMDKIGKETLKLLRASLPVTITINQEFESASVIRANATQIHQIFMNLCTNAAHAMQASGGILTVGLIDTEITKDTAAMPAGLPEGNYLKLTVSDTGTGIPPEIMESIFEPYFTTKATGEGSGMGLALIHGIVEAHGGKIFAESRPGKGSVFSVYLPTIKQRETDLQQSEEKLPTGNERILLVDDESPIARMGKQIMERLGYQVTMRTSSVEALELFRAMPLNFDLVITDMTMPNMTGDTLAAELIRIRPDIPVILCTGYSSKLSEKTAASIGIRALVHKPVVKAELAKTIRKVLDDKRMNSE
jgi:CheY-like chemotaxis protein